jgi:hypothetical protein
VVCVSWFRRCPGVLEIVFRLPICSWCGRQGLHVPCFAVVGRVLLCQVICRSALVLWLVWLVGCCLLGGGDYGVLLRDLPTRSQDVSTLDFFLLLCARPVRLRVVLVVCNPSISVLMNDRAPATFFKKKSVIACTCHFPSSPSACTTCQVTQGGTCENCR